MYFPYDLSVLPEEERIACDEFVMAESAAWHAVKKMFGRQGQPATSFLQWIVDNVWIDAYRDAKKRFDPERGVKFKTFLYRICRNKAFNKRRKFLVNCPPRLQDVTVTVGMRGNGIHYLYSPEILREIHDLRYCKYLFDFSDSNIHFLPLGYNYPFYCEALFGTLDDFEEDDHPVGSVPENIQWAEYAELFARVAAIDDDELRTINSRRLPKLFKKLTKEALRKELARIDVHIVEQLVLGINPDARNVTKKEIQLRVGVKRNFYEYRIEAITERLNLEQKYRERLRPRSTSGVVKEECVHRARHLAVQLNPPVKRKVFTFRVANKLQRLTGATETNSVTPQKSVAAEDVFLWQDRPGETQRKEKRNRPKSERWHLVELFVDQFSDDR